MRHRNPLFQQDLSNHFAQQNNAAHGRTSWNTKAFVGVVQTIQNTFIQDRAVAGHKRIARVTQEVIHIPQARCQTPRGVSVSTRQQEIWFILKKTLAGLAHNSSRVSID